MKGRIKLSFREWCELLFVSSITLVGLIIVIRCIQLLIVFAQIMLR